MDYETFFKLSPDLLGVVGPDRRFLELNPTWERVMGYSLQELKARPIMDFVHPEDRERTMETAGALNRDGKLHHFENRLIAKDGSSVWLSWSVSLPLAGHPGQMYLVAKEITQRKLREAELEKSRSLIEGFLDNVPAISYAVDLDGHLIFINREFEKTLGVSRDSHLGRKPEEVFPVETAELFRRAEERALKTGLPQSGESEAMVGAERRHFSNVLFPLRDRAGRLTGTGVISTDITERWRNREQLRQAAEEILTQKTFLRDVVSSLPYSVFWKDRDSVYLGCNERFMRHAGLSSTEEIVGKTDFDLPWKREESEFYRKCDQEVMESNRPLLNIEETQLASDGRELILITSKVPFHDASGKVIGILGAYNEITEIRETQRQLAIQQAKLIAASKMSSLGEMASGIAHEINNPLAIIHGKASRLRSRIEDGTALPENITRDLEKIEVTAMRISKIIRGLHAFSRNSDNDPFTRVPIALIVEETLELCQERFRQGAVKLVVAPLPDLHVDCRPVQLSQVLLNLLNNAFDAVCGLEEKVVELEVQDLGPRLRLTVTDSGPGIPRVIADKLMQPFFTTKELGKGTGLGLSIAKGIVDDHRGTLALNTACRKTQFVVEIPKNRTSEILL